MRFEKNMLDLKVPGFKAKPYGDRFYIIWDETEQRFLETQQTGAMRKVGSTWEAQRFMEGLVKGGKEALVKILAEE